MNISARLLAVALIAVPAVPVLAATPAAAAGPVLVARYTFDGGVSPAGKVSENSGRGVALTVRSADRGTVRFPAATGGKYAGLPARCAKAAKVCPKALLEGSDDPDLDPGTRRFTWAASVRVSKAQLAGSANVVQKGVATTESQWKMQVGLKNGRAQCVVVGRGSAKAYVARSSAGVADGNWHKILCQRSGASLSVHVDGALKGRTAVPAAMSILNDKPLRIGGPNFHTTSDMFHGDVDDVYAQLG
jgi:hypothetical protein